MTHKQKRIAYNGVAVLLLFLLLPFLHLLFSTTQWSDVPYMRLLVFNAIGLAVSVALLPRLSRDARGLGHDERRLMWAFHGIAMLTLLLSCLLLIATRDPSRLPIFGTILLTSGFTTEFIRAGASQESTKR
jgi:hypothetical protein